MLKGRFGVIPYVAQAERDDEILNPTVFYLKPKNIKGHYQTVAAYAKATANAKQGERNPTKLVEADVEDFLSFCEKVENYEFSERFPELSSSGAIKEIAEKTTLTSLVSDLDPTILAELQNAVTDWKQLTAAEDYWKQFKAKEKKK